MTIEHFELPRSPALARFGIALPAVCKLVRFSFALSLRLLPLVALAFLSPISGLLKADPYRDAGPPAVPLVTSDPYFSIWSDANHLYDDRTRHWTHAEQPLVSLIRIDGKSFRLMGNEPDNLPVLPQVGLKVTPTRSIYDFDDQHVHVTLTFLTPALPNDLDVLTRPLTYLIWDVHSVDGQPHAISVFASASSWLTVNTLDQQVTCQRATAGGLTTLRTGSVDQTLFEPAGDGVRIDWGYLYLAASSNEAKAAFGGDAEVLDSFVQTGQLPSLDDAKLPRAAKNDPPIMAFSWDLGQVIGIPASRTAMLAYDELFEVQFARQNLLPYWKRNGATMSDLLQAAQKDYSTLLPRCEAFDQQLVNDMTRIGGKDYARLTALAYRQCLAATGIAADANKQPLLFTKENTSNGDIATVDVIYPAEPLFLLLSPTLAKASLVPVLDYAASNRWKFPNAPHDLGVYPIASASGSASEAMVVEESGNMLIMADAIMQADGDKSFVDPWWPKLTEWAKFLEQYGLDPNDQLCTDDFMGHLAHNANLSLKAILALAAFGDMCQRRGDIDDAKRYHDLAVADALHWMQAADDGDHYRLAFNLPGTWSEKYNLVWDKLLGLNIFPPTVAEKEIAYYKKVIQPYGLPLDSRTTNTKTDWSVWCAALAENQADFQAIISPIATYFDHTTSRSPLADYYDTVNLHSDVLHARPVIGGLFIKMLSDDGVWKKWARADKTAYGPWASFPPHQDMTYILPATATEPFTWRKTETQPPENWMKPDFDDSSWTEAPGGFGTYGAFTHSPWGPNQNSNIWLRKTITVPQGKYHQLAFAVAHDNAVEIYVNGVLAFKAGDHDDTPQFQKALPEAAGLLRAGAELHLAVHCHQDDGGQVIDVRLVDLAPPEEESAPPQKPYGKVKPVNVDLEQNGEANIWIYVGLNGGKPHRYLLDTGSWGFYALYSPGWWPGNPKSLFKTDGFDTEMYGNMTYGYTFVPVFSSVSLYNYFNGVQAYQFPEDDYAIAKAFTWYEDYEPQKGVTRPSDSITKAIKSADENGDDLLDNHGIFGAGTCLQYKGSEALGYANLSNLLGQTPGDGYVITDNGPIGRATLTVGLNEAIRSQFSQFLSMRPNYRSGGFPNTHWPSYGCPIVQISLARPGHKPIVFKGSFWIDSGSGNSNVRMPTGASQEFDAYIASDGSLVPGTSVSVSDPTRKDGLDYTTVIPYSGETAHAFTGQIAGKDSDEVGIWFGIDFFRHNSILYDFKNGVMGFSSRRPELDQSILDSP